MGLRGLLSLMRLVFHRCRARVREMRLSEGSGRKWLDGSIGLLLEDLKVP